MIQRKNDYVLKDFYYAKFIKRFKISFLANSIKGERALFDGVKIDNVVRIKQKKSAE